MTQQDVSRFEQASPASSVGCGALLAEGGTFPLMAHEVCARVTGPLAAIEVRQTFTHPHDQPLEGTYVLPMPSDATLYDFEVRVGNRTFRGGVHEKIALPPRQDPSGLRSLTIGTIRPHEEVTVEFVYLERLEVVGTEVQVRIPLPAQTRPKVEVLIDTGGLAPRNLSCSHPATWTPDGHGTVRVNLASAAMGRDFVLHVDLAQPRSSGLLFTSGEHFLLWTLPPTVEAARTPRDLLFLIDRSCSMAGEKIGAARRAVRHFLDQLGPDDRFALAAFDNELDLYRGGRWCEAASVDDATAWLEESEPRGGTEVLAPLDWVLDREPEEGRLVMAVLITDGQVGNEAAICKRVRESQSPVRLWTFGVGDSVHGAFLRQLSNGRCALVSDGPSLEEAAARLARETSRPVASDLQMVDRGLHIVPDSLVAQQPLDLFATRPVSVAGRRRGEGDVILHTPVWSLVATPTATSNPAVSLLWAVERIRNLEDRLALGESPELEDELRALALRYRLPSRYTSFMVADESYVDVDDGDLLVVADWGASPPARGVDEVIRRELAPRVDEEAIARLARTILRQAFEVGASFIHLEPGERTSRVRFRVGAELREIATPPRQAHAPLVRRLKGLAGLDERETRHSQMGNCQTSRNGQSYRMQVSTRPGRLGEAVCIKIKGEGLATTGIDRTDLPGGVLARLLRLLEEPGGLILVTGAPGSGCPELMASLIDSCPDRHCITVDAADSEGIDDAREQDVDVLAVTGVLDSGDLQTLVRMSLERSVVLAAWPGRDAAEAYRTLQETPVERHLLGASLRGILALKALPRLCPTCQGAGCPSCSGKGTAGVALASEWWEMDQGRPIAFKSRFADEMKRLAEAGVIAPERP